MRTILVAMVLAVVPMTANAEKVTYDCQMKNLEPTLGWITER